MFGQSGKNHGAAYAGTPIFACVLDLFMAIYVYVMFMYNGYQILVIRKRIAHLAGYESS